MNKKSIVTVVLLAVAVFLCGSVLTNLQNRVAFPQELKEWYTQHSETVHTTDWLEVNGFTYSAILSTESPNAHFCQLPTTGGYTHITVFDTCDNDVPLRFKAKSDVFRLSKGDEFTYQFTIGTKTDDYVWINIYADTKAHADTAVDDVTAFLESTV